MRCRQVCAWSLGLAALCGTASGQHHSMHSSHGGRAGSMMVPMPLHVAHGRGGGGWASFRANSYYGSLGSFGSFGSYMYASPLYAMGPGVGFPMFGPMFMPVFDPGIALGAPLPGPGMAGMAAVPGAPKAKRLDPAKSVQLVTIGDRLFRAGNLRRAAERYEQAIKADPNSAAPRIHLAQVALARGQFAEAANHVRDALTAEPRWLVTAPDIQAMYAEPGDFAKQIARLESHLHATPTDRDAWLVLGAQLYLSGRTRKSADIFLRLTDRKPDPTLAAFLEATAPPEPERK